MWFAQSTYLPGIFPCISAAGCFQGLHLSSRNFAYADPKWYRSAWDSSLGTWLMTTWLINISVLIEDSAFHLPI